MGKTDSDIGEPYLGRRSETRRKRSSGSNDGGRTKKSKYSEEEIAVYMVRKTQKKAARLLAAGYSNPLGESNVSEKFVWKKKIERDVSVHGATTYSCVYKAEKRRQKEIMAEIEKLKRRRQGRVVEKAAGRLEGDEFEVVDWEKKEKEFELEQSKLRSEIRFREGRAKAIDILLSKSLSSEVDLDLDLVFKGLTVKELEEVRDEIKLKLDVDLDLEEKDSDEYYCYWKAVVEVCNWEIATAVSLKEISCSWGGLHPSIEEDMRDYLEKKTHRDLEEIQCGGEEELNSGKGKIAEFWEDTLKRIQRYKAIAYLREFHNAKISMHHPNLQQSAADAMEEEEVVVGLRKPKYVTQVHTGYAWNKYNQIHYNHENPPPKVVKGYKLKIFYPELVEAVPTYTIEKDDESSSGETCIIRFHAGLPYQDIAFRIVNGDWELSVNKGFKSTFHSGILRLYFNFKRYHYRR